MTIITTATCGDNSGNNRLAVTKKSKQLAVTKKITAQQQHDKHKSDNQPHGGTNQRRQN